MTSANRLFLPRLLTAALLVFVSLDAFAKEIAGRVVAVADGDTATVLVAGRQQVKVRLAAIDAPERAQPFGNRSKQALSTLIFGKDVTVRVTDTDRYKRTVGIIMLGDTDINLEMVRLGYAWVYRQYVIKLPRAQALQYSAAEDIARREKRGLWVDKDPTPPWEWRRKK
ncbi:MAG: thermonuclease family protein [Burkholderiaceae bacterium]